MDVGVVALLVVEERVENHPRLLRGGGIVEIDERTTVDLLVEDREILAQSGPVYGLVGKHRCDALASGVVFGWRAISHFVRRILQKVRHDMSLGRLYSKCARFIRDEANLWVSSCRSLLAGDSGRCALARVEHRLPAGSCNLNTSALVDVYHISPSWSLAASDIIDWFHVGSNTT